jgi:hypothetical protein
MVVPTAVMAGVVVVLDVKLVMVLHIVAVVVNVPGVMAVKAVVSPFVVVVVDQVVVRFVVAVVQIPVGLLLRHNTIKR